MKPVWFKISDGAPRQSGRLSAADITQGNVSLCFPALGSLIITYITWAVWCATAVYLYIWNFCLYIIIKAAAVCWFFLACHLQLVTVVGLIRLLSHGGFLLNWTPVLRSKICGQRGNLRVNSEACPLLTGEQVFFQIRDKRVFKHCNQFFGQCH